MIERLSDGFRNRNVTDSERLKKVGPKVSVNDFNDHFTTRQKPLSTFQDNLDWHKLRPTEREDRNLRKSITLKFTVSFCIQPSS